ncbi:MAG TPA: hypothetical protein DHV26_15370 [Cytophagales bacterium]|nr:hypothetical protein [Cytophagales bacterium]HRG08447.1 hypothetical protein [Cyclobacteriaceae bacterium]
MNFPRTLLVLVLLSFLFTKAHAQPDTVTVGSYVISVHDINFRDKEYTMRFWLWFLYDNPDFDFSTQLDIPNAKSIDTPEITLDSVGNKAWAIMKMKATMKESWKVADFPFDKQHLKVQIENALFDINSLVFKPDIKGSTYDKDEALDGWQITDFKVSAQLNDYETGFGDPSPHRDYQNFSAFLIELDIERNAWGLFLKIFIGMYIAFLISIISFTIQVQELEPRFGLPVGGLFATVGNKYIIDSILPETSAFTLVDTLHTLTFFGIFSTLVVSAIALRKFDNGKKEAAIRFNYVGSRLVIGFYIVANLIIVALAIW